MKEEYTDSKNIILEGWVNVNVHICAYRYIYIYTVDGRNPAPVDR